MDAADLRAFANRPWQELERMKLEHGVARLHGSGGAANLRIGYSLFAHARRVQTGFPSPDARRADLENHIRLKELLARASSSVPRR